MNILRIIDWKRAVIALAALALVASAGFLGTRAFFSDTETSVGNVFAAGSLDLKVGVKSDDNAPNFAPKSIPGNQVMLDFSDMIPGDSATGYFRLESTQDAYACVAGDVTETPENNRLEAEEKAGDGTPGTNKGELQNYMEVAIWEGNPGFVDGLVGPEEDDTLQVMTLAEFANGDYYTLQDSARGDNPLLKNNEVQHEFAYCFGKFERNSAGGIRITDKQLTCDGGGFGTDTNQAQTDGVVATLHFYAEQMQSNESFVCSSIANPNDETQVVGANLTEYVAPTTCDATVAGNQSIQSAIDAAAAGDTICVAGGYNGTGDNGPIRVNKDNITLAAQTQGINLDVPVVLDNDGATVTGFTGSDDTVLGESAAFYVNNEVTGYEISFNDVDGGVNGVLTSTNGSGTSGLIANNTFNNLTRGIFFNNAQSTTVEFNDFTGGTVGIANDFVDNVTVRYNEFSGNGESIGYLGDAGSSMTVSQNNILDGGVNNYGTETLNAKNNWWGVDGRADQINAAGSTGLIDGDPEASSEFPQN